jgi:hypothetical protein
VWAAQKNLDLVAMVRVTASDSSGGRTGPPMPMWYAGPSANGPGTGKLRSNPLPKKARKEEDEPLL